ncbi:MAG: glycosyltransferase family 4 protein [Gemmatimonadales bacterium]
MRVLITLHQGGGSGAVHSTLHLALGLARRGALVRFVCPPGSWVEGEARKGGLAVHPVELVSRRRWANARKLLAVLERHPVDVINPQSSRDREAFTLLALLGKLRAPLVLTRRSWPRTSRLENWFANRAADRVIAISEPVRAELAATGIAPEKLVVVHTGVLLDRIDVPVSDTERARWRQLIGWEPSRRTVGIVARPKDQQVVLAALDRVQTPVRLVLAGLTPEALALPLPQIPERHAVVRLGFDPAIRPLYDLLEIALHPSRHDALPQAVLEAMALGKPVLASRATGNAVAIRDEVDGLLAIPDDPGDWARQLERLLQDPALCERLGVSARGRAREAFSLERTVEGTLAVYESFRVAGPTNSVIPSREAARNPCVSEADSRSLAGARDDSHSELLFAYDFPPRPGGIATALGEIVRAAGGRMAVSTGTLAGSEAADQALGVTVARAPVAAERLRTLGGLIRWGRSGDQLIRAARPRFLWAGNLKPAGHVVRWLAARHRLPYGLIVYGLDLGIVAEQARRSRRKRNRARALFADAAGVVAISGWTAKRCRALLAELGVDVPDDCVRVIPLAADPVRFTPDGPRYPLPPGEWLLTVARLVPHKGIDTGIEVLARLAPAHPTLRYAIAGTGPDLDRLRARAQALGVADRVTFLGAVPPADLPALYRSATLYLALSREDGAEAEGFGLSIVEAEASGRPVIAGRSGGIGDAVVEGSSALLVPPGDVNMVAETLEALLGDGERRLAMGTAGRRLVEERLNWVRVVEDLRVAAESWAAHRSSPGPVAR